MTQLPTPDSEALRARYPLVFNRPVSARLATPVMMFGAFGIFVFGLADLDFSAIYRLLNHTESRTEDAAEHQLVPDRS